jgi:hypothetical protein
MAQQMAASQAQCAQYNSLVANYANQQAAQNPYGIGLFSAGQMIRVRSLNDAAQVQFGNRNMLLIKYVPVRRRRTFLQKLLRRPYDRSQERDISDRELVLSVGSQREI